MTDAQWLMEYYSLQQKEKNEYTMLEDGLKALRSLLVNVLGLNLLNDLSDVDANEEMFIPMSVLVGRREVAETILKKVDEDINIDKVMSDDSFEEMSKALANGTIDDIGDMDPIFDIDESKIEEMQKEEREKELAMLGVKIVEHTPVVPHISFDNEDAMRDAQHRAHETKIAEQIIREEIEKTNIKVGLSGSKKEMIIEISDDGPGFPEDGLEVVPGKNYQRAFEFG